MRLFAPRHSATYNVGPRSRAPRAKRKNDSSSEDTLISVDDVVAGGDAKQLAARIQESLLSSETMVSTAADGNGSLSGSLVASSAPEWLVWVGLFPVGKIWNACHLLMLPLLSDVSSKLTE